MRHAFNRQTLVIMSLVCLLFAGCAGERPPSAQVHISASSDLNPDASGRPSPIVVKLFALRSTDGFNNARFRELYENTADTLGIDLVNQVEFQVLPGQESDLDELTFGMEARYIGLLAAFRDLDNAVWRTAVPLELGDTAEFAIVLDRLSVSTRPQ